MKLKKREFEDLRQWGSTVTQYLDQFTQLARYANDEYMTEDKKMEKFHDGLIPSLKCQLVVHTFPDFKTLVDKAIILENQQRKHHNRIAVLSTTGPKIRHSIRASPVMPAEEKGITPGNAQSREIILPSPTITAVVQTQPPNATTSTPIT